MVGLGGLEPPTSRLSGVRSDHLSYKPNPGGDERNRTADPLLARQALSQLSYTPKWMVGLGGLEPPTSRLSGVRSNHLSYTPTLKRTKQ